MAQKKEPKKKVSFEARSGEKTSSIGKSVSKSSSDKSGKKSTGKSAGKSKQQMSRKRTSSKKLHSSGRSSRKKKLGINWSFIVAGAILLSTYLIVVLFNGAHWQGWDESFNELKTTFIDTADSIRDTLEKADSELAENSSPDDLTFDLPSGTDSSSSTVSVHFIDVGQGDSILISGGGENVLIDAGENDKGEVVLAYLAENEVEKIDLAVGTHPHSDHIGGMDTVLEGITVEKLIMPDVPDSIVPTTKTYLSVLSSAEDTGTEMSYSYPGDTYSLCGGTFTVLGPIEDYTDLNSESLVIRFDFGDTSFLFTGDQEKDAEADLVDSGANLSADVLKVGHHGSYTSTSEKFLSEVSPSIAVISCGQGNDYGHPHDEVVERLESADAEIYRTDLLGSIVITSDGQSLSVSSEKAA